MLESSKYQVFPLDDRKTDRLNAQAAGRPTAQVALGRVDHTCGYLFSSSDALDIGFDNGAPVVEDYGAPRGRFQGDIASIQLNVDPQHHHDPAGMAEAIVRRQ